MCPDAHAATVDVDVEGAVFVRAFEHPVGVRWSAQLLDLLLQEIDLLASLAQGHDELVVVGLQPEQPLAESLGATALQLELGQEALEPLRVIVGVSLEKARDVAHLIGDLALFAIV